MHPYPETTDEPIEEEEHLKEPRLGFKLDHAAGGARQPDDEA